MRTILLAPLQLTVCKRGRDGRTSCITRSVRCIRMQRARKEEANEDFGDRESRVERGERRARERVSDDSRHPKVEAEDGRFAVCASACCLRQNAGGMQCLAAALRYRLHASPNPYVSTRVLSVFRLVSLSKLSRSAKCETRRASKRRRDALARNKSWNANRAARPQTDIDSQNPIQ